jgi:phosphinothricin acetyltransferase
VNGPIVRASTEADLARCTEICSHRVLHGTASFEVDPPDLVRIPSELLRAAWWADRERRI